MQSCQDISNRDSSFTDTVKEKLGCDIYEFIDIIQQFEAQILELVKKGEKMDGSQNVDTTKILESFGQRLITIEKKVHAVENCLNDRYQL